MTLRARIGAGLGVALAGLGLAGAASAARVEPAPAAKAPEIRQLVVFESGRVIFKPVRARQITVTVGGRRCTAGDGTALAALVRSHVGKVGLRDFGGCSRRPRDGAGLFVRSIGQERNRGQNGWAYKVGRRGASAGAADPSGPLGKGLLRPGQGVTWFYCRLQEGGCQRSLEVRSRIEAGAVVATVRGYDDEGGGIPVEGASVAASGTSGVTGAGGSVRLELQSGRHTLVARKEGLVRSFAETVVVP